MKSIAIYSPEDPLLTAQQAAAELGIGVSTFWRDVLKAHLPAPYYVTPKAPRWRRSELHATVAARPRHAAGKAALAACAADQQPK